MRLPQGEGREQVGRLLHSRGLHTVCEEAHCPNKAECWGRGTATFLVLGDICTRNCRFCAVTGGKPMPPDKGEPERVAEAVKALGLKHVVITSVTRDDLPDGGALIFSETIRTIYDRFPQCTVEVLVPDFNGSEEALAQVLAPRPHVLAHNLETVPRLYGQVRPQAQYQRSLELLAKAKVRMPQVLVKSGIMLGLGESLAELHEVMHDLRQTGCDILTIGQYLSPSRHHFPVKRYWTPDEFEVLKQEAIDLGFPWVESGPLVRSSYRAEAVFG